MEIFQKSRGDPCGRPCMVVARALVVARAWWSRVPVSVCSVSGVRRGDPCGRPCMVVVGAGFRHVRFQASVGATLVVAHAWWSPMQDAWAVPIRRATTICGATMIRGATTRVAPTGGDRAGGNGDLWATAICGQPQGLPLPVIFVQPSIKFVHADTLGVFTVQRPAQGICPDVLADAAQGMFVSDDVFVVVALPQATVKRRVKLKIHATNVFHRGNGFECPHNRPHGGILPTRRGRACPCPRSCPRVCGHSMSPCRGRACPCPCRPVRLVVCS